MFESLTQRLSHAVQRMSGRGRITEENIRDVAREIRRALLEADVALPVVKGLIYRVQRRALGTEVAKSVNPGQAFVKIVHDELIEVLGGSETGIEPRGRPTTIMLVGLQGTGKTTTAAKLARFLAHSSDEVLLASTDVYRPAARTQLRTLADELGTGFVDSDTDSPPVLAQQALTEAQARRSRWLILDTAGRLHVDDAMMSEARALHSVLKPEETLYVVDAMAGQDALNSARAFHDALPLTGVVLTKTDGDSRGGAALSVREVTGLPIKFIGTGEKFDALEAFVPRRMASRILGMGDVVGLVEDVQRQVDAEAVENIAGKVKRGRQLDLEDFKTQLEQIRNMGGMETLLDKIPGLPNLPAAAGGMNDQGLRRQIGIIDSMTPRERRRPELINGSRKRRIATGAGRPVQEVSHLLKQHRQLAKTMKRVSRGGLKGLLEGLQNPSRGIPVGKRRGGPGRPRR